MQSPLNVTRTLVDEKYPEHRYPQPTRNVLSTVRRDANKRKQASAPTMASEVRRGYRCSDGTIVYYLTDSEYAAIRQEELNNLMLEKAQRAQRMREHVAARTAEVDSWAHKS